VFAAQAHLTDPSSVAMLAAVVIGMCVVFSRAMLRIATTLFVVLAVIVAITGVIAVADVLRRLFPA